jgi:hypothetical protein
LQGCAHITYLQNMPKAAEAIEAWLAAGDTEAFLRIEDDTVVVLGFGCARVRSKERTMDAAAAASKIQYLFADYAPAVRERLRLDTVALYSVTPSWMARRICTALLERVGSGARITDATACVGGDAMAFAAVFASVTAVEVDGGRAAMLAANVITAGVAHKVTVLHADYCAILDTLEQDVVYIDAPWGGPDHWRHNKLDLWLQHGAESVPLVDVCARAWPRTALLALKVPANFDGEKFMAEFTAAVRPAGYDGCIAWKCIDMRKALLLIVRKS